jgi:(2Fe-2S) ferredoxin
MRSLTLKPRIQIWVCVNERSHHELPSCLRERGEDVVTAFQQALRAFPAERSGHVWINRTLCQGSCNPNGVSVVVEPAGKRYQGVLVSDVQAILEECL